MLKSLSQRKMTFGLDPLHPLNLSLFRSLAPSRSRSHQQLINYSVQICNFGCKFGKFWCLCVMSIISINYIIFIVLFNIISINYINSMWDIKEITHILSLMCEDCSNFASIMLYKSVQKFVRKSIQCMVANFQSQLTLTHTHTRTRTLTLYCTNFSNWDWKSVCVRKFVCVKRFVQCTSVQWNWDWPQGPIFPHLLIVLVLVTCTTSTSTSHKYKYNYK